MTNAELKLAMLSSAPVIHKTVRYGEIKYRRISGILYRPGKDVKINISAELEDCNDSRGVVIVKGEDVHIDDGGANGAEKELDS